MEILCVPVGPLQANCYLVWDEGSLACAVDPGGEPERLARLVEKRGLRLEAVLVTHGHFDHVEGVKGLAEATGARVYCSAQVQPVLAGDQGCSATGYPVPALGEPAVEIVEDGSKITVGSTTVTVIATPGHTPGDVTYEIDGGLFCGDLLFRRSVGRTDFPGGNFAQLLGSVARLVRLYPQETPVYPGHMDSTTLGEELAHNPFLASLKVHG
jgi:glyoxylase-like metal-dependent hydrolase (beta-lactamase superfamily II)